MHAPQSETHVLQMEPVAPAGGRDLPVAREVTEVSVNLPANPVDPQMSTGGAEDTVTATTPAAVIDSVAAQLASLRQSVGRNSSGNLSPDVLSQLTECIDIITAIVHEQVKPTLHDSADETMQLVDESEPSFTVEKLDPGILWLIRLALTGTGFCWSESWAQDPPMYGVSKRRSVAWAVAMAIYIGTIGYLALSWVRNIADEFYLFAWWAFVVALMLGPAEALSLHHLRQTLFAVKGEQMDASAMALEDPINSADDRAQTRAQIVELLTAEVTSSIAQQAKKEYKKAISVTCLSSCGWMLVLTVLLFYMAGIIGDGTAGRIDQVVALGTVITFTPVVQLQFHIGLNCTHVSE